MERKKKGIFVIVAAGLGFLLQLLAYVTPGWILLRDLAKFNGPLDLGYSVWYAKYCYRMYCTTLTPSPGLDFGSNQVPTRSDWIEIEVETTVAILCSLLGFITSLCYLRKGESLRVSLGTSIGILSLFLAGIMPIIPIGKVSHLNARLKYFLEDVNAHSTVQVMVPYCPIIAGIGAVLEFVAAISFSYFLHSTNHEARRTITRGRASGVVLSVISNDIARVQPPPSYQEVMEGCNNMAIVLPSYDEAVKGDFYGTGRITPDCFVDLHKSEEA